MSDDPPKLTGPAVTATVPADLIIAAGTGRTVEWTRDADHERLTEPQTGN